VAHTTIVIDAPPEKIWEIVADHTNMPKWLKALRKVTLPDAPKTGVGTRRWVSPGGPIVLKEVITHFEAPRLFGYSVRGGVPVKKHQGFIELTPVATGKTRVVYTTEIQTPIPIPGDPLGWVAAIALNKSINDGLKNLKKLAER
jgi:uncharacterized protein YndB with AHSA1/START domain